MSLIRTLTLSGSIAVLSSGVFAPTLSDADYCHESSSLYRLRGNSRRPRRRANRPPQRIANSQRAAARRQTVLPSPRHQHRDPQESCQAEEPETRGRPLAKGAIGLFEP